MREVAPGLRYWTAPHPQWNGATGWPEDIGCVYYEAADALALIDPLLPRGEEERFLVALDRDVARLDRPVALLLTAPWCPARAPIRFGGREHDALAHRLTGVRVRPLTERHVQNGHVLLRRLTVVGHSV